MLQCNECKQWKGENEFYKNNTKRGYFRKCKKCHIECGKQWEKNNPEKVKEKRKRQYQKNKEKKTEKI